MAQPIRSAYFWRIGILAVVLALSVPDRVDSEQTVTLSLPPGVMLQEGSYNVQFQIEGKKFPAKVNVAGAASAAPAAAATSAPQPDLPQEPAPPQASASEPAALHGQSRLPWYLLALVAAGAGGLVALGAWLYSKIMAPRKYLRPYREALQMMKDGSYEEALPILTSIESRLSDANRRDARFFIGFANYRLKKHADAEHVLTSLHGEDPSDVRVAYLLGQLCMEMERFDDAERVLEAIEKNGRLDLYHARKLLGVVKYQRALVALREGRVDAAAELFTKVEALGDFSGEIPRDLRDRNIALGTKALFDKNLPEARLHFTSLDKAAAEAEEDKRPAMLAAACMGQALAHWIEDTAESLAQAEALLVRAALQIDAKGATEAEWSTEAERASLSDQLLRIEKEGEKSTAELGDDDKCLRDLHLLRAMIVLRLWAALEGKVAHRELGERLRACEARLACSLARDPDFSHPYLVRGLLLYYLSHPGKERTQALDLLERAQALGMNDPDALEIINNRRRIEMANADAVDKYLQVLDRYLNDPTVRDAVRRGLVKRLTQYRKFQKWKKSYDLDRVGALEPTIEEVRNRSEVLRVRVEEILRQGLGDEEARRIEGLSSAILQDSEVLQQRAAAIEKNESELLVATGSQLLRDE